jgi:hypothetical protein
VRALDRECCRLQREYANKPLTPPHDSISSQCAPRTDRRMDFRPAPLPCPCRFRGPCSRTVSCRRNIGQC